MLLRQLMEVYDFLDKPSANGEEIATLLRSRGAHEVVVKKASDGKCDTDCVKIIIHGKNGKSSGGSAPTIGVIGRLGGIGARPEVIGFVSDGDGALAALTVALKLSEMNQNGDILEGDVIVATHVCPYAQTEPHKPVPFMGSPINMDTMNRMEVDERMDAILSIDTTKGNRVINVNGFAISPTVKEGYILESSNDIMDIMMRTSGKMPQIFALSQQDITPYGNDLFHLNSILQPACATDAPVIGVAITTEQMVAGCGTGATHGVDVEDACRFVVEVAKYFTAGECSFYDKTAFKHLMEIYGSLSRYQTLGNVCANA